MTKGIRPPSVTRLNRKRNKAPQSHHCDICLGDTGVLWAWFPVHWSPPDKELEGSRRLCHICASCQGDDGGIVTIISSNGLLVYRCGSQSQWPNRFVIVPGEHTVH